MQPRGGDLTQVTELKPNIGAEIKADRQALLEGTHAAEIRDLLERRGVLVFPRIALSDEELVRFTRTLGIFATEIHGEESYKITMDVAENARADYLKGAFYWHIDGTLSKVPILASLLIARVLAPEGGDTELCNTYAA